MSEQLKKSYSLGGIDIDHDYRVKIPFKLINGDVSAWNEYSATAVDMFGLPGEKYTCRITHSNIEFWFLDEKDAMMFELVCG